MDALQRKNLMLLTLGQGLTGSIISLLTLSSTLVGIRMTPLPVLATLPVTATVCGAALMIYPVSSLMARYGRKYAFIMGTLLGVAGCALAMTAILLFSFALFVLATLVLGMSSAFNPYYRFAAAEIGGDAQQKNSAISWVVGGGIIGGFLGPFAASRAVELMPPYPFLGSFALAAVICAATGVLLCGLKLPAMTAATAADAAPTSLFAVVKSRAFLLGTASCSAGFVVMTLLMNAAPLAMHQHHFSVDHSATVLQWHFVAMYAPSFLLIFLAKRLSATTVVALGIVCNLAGIALALTGLSLSHFLTALVLLGIGWAFMFNGGTFMLNAFAHSAHKSRLQGINSLATYFPNALASLSAGSLMAFGHGWAWVNVIGAVLLLLMLLALCLPARR